MKEKQNTDARLHNMENNIIRIPSYIYGTKRYSENINQRVIRSLDNLPLFEIHDVDEWGLKAAIESASINQQDLTNIPTQKIVDIIVLAMDFFFDNSDKYRKIVEMTGSPYSYIKNASEKTKLWAKNISEFVPLSLGLKDDKHFFPKSTSPVVAVLPGNSDQEVLFVLTQTLLSKNSTIVRPSNSGASAYAVMEFINAINLAIDKLDDPEIEPLRSAIAQVNTSNTNYLDTLSFDNWNYIFFGSDSTIATIEKKIRFNCSPRKILSHGTGLSISIVMEDVDVDKIIIPITESITMNRGNECIDTDIMYVHDDIFDEFQSKINLQARKYISGDPYENKKIGILEKDNVNFCVGEAIKRGKNQYLNLEETPDRILLHTSIFPISKFETALEYPGPIASLRSFGGINELSFLVNKDLQDNGMTKNLVTSIFTDSNHNFDKVLQLAKTYIIKRNKATNDFNYNLPHQGIYLLRELVDLIHIDSD